MSDAIWFWMAKPVAEFLLAVLFLALVVGLLMAWHVLAEIKAWLNEWMDKKRENSK